MFIKKYRDCGKTTMAQNQAGTVVFKKQPLLTTCDKLLNSKNHVRSWKQKAVGLVLKTEVSGKNWQLYIFFLWTFDSECVLVHLKVKQLNTYRACKVGQKKLWEK